MIRVLSASAFILLCMFFSTGLDYIPYPMSLVDIRCILLAIVPPIICQCILFGTKGFLATAGLFSNSPSPETLRQAQAFLASWAKSLWLFTGVNTVSAVIVLLTYSEDPLIFSKAAGFALLSLLYAFLLHLVLLYPLQARAARMLSFRAEE